MEVRQDFDITAILPQIEICSVKTCDSSKPRTRESSERVQCKAIYGPTCQENDETKYECPQSRK